MDTHWSLQTSAASCKIRIEVSTVRRTGFFDAEVAENGVVGTEQKAKARSNREAGAKPRELGARGSRPIPDSAVRHGGHRAKA